ncbi:uncharacterized protein LOC132257447 [Phlebotomus argentipes]|uniref:uncharacterized protein LOC132257447 n=1 Tax=Phlebotomus argentipes TaxID=94469 RepID=UPI0028931A5C|nr:uncharacterized protein LOC132257447 [Phlebotomus argentipes]
METKCLLYFILSIICMVASENNPDLDTFSVEKFANTSSVIQSLDKTQIGYNYAFGQSHASGYKSKNVEHHLFTPIIEHATNGSNYVIFGNRVEGDVLVARTSQYSYTEEKVEKLRLEFSGQAHMTYVVFESDDPNFTMSTTFKENYILANFIFTRPLKPATVSLTAYGFYPDSLPKTCFLFYYNCVIKS